jgi:hypothetical protein
MTIKELKDLLDQYDENMTVRVFDSGSGNIDITEVARFEGVSANPLKGFPKGYEYICII